MSTEQQRQQWRELAAAATPGEWEPRMDWGKDMTFEGDVFYYGEAQGPHLELDTWDVIGKVRADAAFIAAARAAVPQLLADVDALTQERDALAAELERVRAEAAQNRRAGATKLMQADAEIDGLRASWQQEHTERVRLEERLKAAEQRAEALQAQLADEQPEPMLHRASTRPLWTDDTPTPGTR